MQAPLITTTTAAGRPKQKEGVDNPAASIARPGDRWERRRASRELDLICIRLYGEEAAAEYGIRRPTRAPEPYAAGGMDLDIAGRERAA